MGNTNDIMSHWKWDYDPRPNQKVALEWAQEQSADILLLEIPVGGGKSNLAITISSWLKANSREQRQSSFIVTPQRILQEQYENSFSHNDRISLASFYGKSNYVCMSKGTTCDVGSLVKPKCDKCPHLLAKNRARMSQNVVLSYSLALTSFAYTETFQPRLLTVFDECHSIEDHLVSFDALEITNRRCQKYKIKFKTQTKIGVALAWMNKTYLPDLTRAVQSLQIKYGDIRDKSGTELTRADISKLRELDRLVDHRDEVELMTARKEKYVEDNYVLVNSIDRFQFKRLNGAYSFDKIIRPMSDKFLFMSSTILDKQGFCEDIGIDPDDAAMLSLGSEFPTENRPVFFMPRMRMNKDWNDDGNAQKRKSMIKDLKDVLKSHEGESGLIHTGNFAISSWLVEQLEGKVKHDIFHHNPSGENDRNSAINGFIKSETPSILISPSSTEGLDLKDDLGRFAIFMKVPFGSLGDQWIRRKMELSNKWYRRRALIDMIQGGGRIVRSEDDKGAVYILDASFDFLHRQSRTMVPKWWAEAYHKV